MGEERDMFAGLGWEKEIRSLGDPHVPFNPLPEYDTGVANRYSDDYKMTPFFKSTQAWRWKGSKNDMQKMIRGERMCRRRTLMWMNRWFEWRQVDQHGGGGEGSRRIFEVFVVSQEDEKIIPTSSSIERSNEG